VPDRRRAQRKAFGGIGPPDDLDGPLSKPGSELLSGITAIGEDVAQPWKGPDDLGEQQRGSVAVLDVGGVDRGVDQIAIGVGDDMPRASLDFLACIIAAGASSFGGFHAPAVDDPGAG